MADSRLPLVTSGQPAPAANPSFQVGRRPSSQGHCGVLDAVNGSIAHSPQHLFDGRRSVYRLRFPTRLRDRVAQRFINTDGQHDRRLDHGFAAVHVVLAVGVGTLLVSLAVLWTRSNGTPSSSATMAATLVFRPLPQLGTAVFQLAAADVAQMEHWSTRWNSLAVKPMPNWTGVSAWTSSSTFVCRSATLPRLGWASTAAVLGGGGPGALEVVQSLCSAVQRSLRAMRFSGWFSASSTAGRSGR